MFRHFYTDSTEKFPEVVINKWFDQNSLDNLSESGRIILPLPLWGGHTMKNDIAQQRLKTIEGHIRGIQKMIDQEAYCIDVIRQINAVQSALNKVSTIILDEHLHSCLITAVRSENPDDREKVLKEITEVFQAKAEK